MGGQTDHIDEFHAFKDFTKDDMLSIQPRGRHSGNELLWHA